MTKLFDIVPGWVYAAALAASLVMLTGQTIRAAGLRADLAEAQAVVGRLETERAQAAAQHAQEKLDLIDQHSADIRKADHDYSQKLAAAEARARSDAATVGRLRDQIAAFSRSGGTCQTPAAVADRGETAAEVLGGLLGESVGLLAEGRALHELRDAEVKLLLDQIDADRAACQSAGKPHKSFSTVR